MRIFTILLSFLCLYACPVYAAKHKNIQHYTNSILNEINHNWKPDKEIYTSKRIIVEFDIDKSGNLDNLEFVKSSNIEKLDTSIINAVQKTAPFDPLPVSYKKDKASVQFTFNFNNFKEKSKKEIKKQFDNQEKQMLEKFSRGQKSLYKKYKSHVLTRVNANWKRPLNTKPKDVFLTFNVKKNQSKLSEIKVLNTSGSRIYDDMSIDALEDTIIREIPETIDDLGAFNFYVEFK